ncbi:MAG: 3-deoxy-manno-octulosonate cytidylyltransferase [Acidobacteriota bacterium]|nr:3-deoxy-manno-octulosonate cytidylyltransferase [Acidobacteriota bacterium]
MPARWGSTRLPGKPLRSIAGRTMVEHVYRRVQQAASIQRVVVLTDHEDIRRAVVEFGGEAQMTPEDCASGTDRIAWAARGWAEAVVVNVQGDEPLIDPDAVDRLARHLQQHPDDDLVTLAAPAAPEEVDDPNAVKVVLDRSDYALYFSRAAIPYDRDGAGDLASRPVLKHLGIYGYQRAALLRLADLEPTPLEICEKLEQLRALENGMRLKVLRVASAAPGVDTEHDLARVEQLLAQSPN